MAVWYVSTGGSDSNPGTQAAPWRHILFGAQTIAGGDTLLVMAGTYDEVLMNPSIASGSPSAYTRIAAYPGTDSPGERDPSLAGKPSGWDTVWITPSAGTGASSYIFYFTANQQYIEVDGINLNALDTAYGPFAINSVGGGNPHHFRFKNAEVIFGSNVITAGGTVGFYLGASDEFGASIPGFIGGNEFYNLKIHGGGIQSGQIITYTHYINSSNNIVGGCDLYNTGLAALQIYNGYGGTPNGNILRNNWIHDVVLTTNTQPTYNGILTATDANTLIYNNVIWNIGLNNGNGSQGISLFSSSGSQVYNNTVYGISGNTDVGIWINSNSSATVRNNISYHHNANFTPSGSTVEDHNLFLQDPLFLNAGTNDFRIALTSPAVDAGLTIAGVNTDINGMARPTGAYDIGAFEFGSVYGGSQPPSGTPPPPGVPVPPPEHCCTCPVTLPCPGPITPTHPGPVPIPNPDPNYPPIIPPGACAGVGVYLSALDAVYAESWA